ncbi:MAG: hypothetical protein ACK49H_08925, partial [Burkholderiales bacterium]
MTRFLMGVSRIAIHCTLGERRSHCEQDPGQARLYGLGVVQTLDGDQGHGANRQPTGQKKDERGTQLWPEGHGPACSAQVGPVPFGSVRFGTVPFSTARIGADTHGAAAHGAV